MEIGEGDGRAEGAGTVFGCFFTEEVDWENEVDLSDGRMETVGPPEVKTELR